MFAVAAFDKATGARTLGRERLDIKSLRRASGSTSRLVSITVPTRRDILFTKNLDKGTEWYLEQFVRNHPTIFSLKLDPRISLRMACQRELGKSSLRRMSSSRYAIPCDARSPIICTCERMASRISTSTGRSNASRTSLHIASTPLVFGDGSKFSVDPMCK
jgi:hypothetical protein